MSLVEKHVSVKCLYSLRISPFFKKATDLTVYPEKLMEITLIMNLPGIMLSNCLSCLLFVTSADLTKGEIEDGI